MKLKTLATILAFAVVVGIALAQSGKTAGEGAEHDFGTKILVVVTHTGGTNGERGGGYYEKARIRKLGDKYFLVGQVPDFGEDFKANRGIVVWTALSDITQMSEYDSMDAMRKAHAETKKADKEK